MKSSEVASCTSSPMVSSHICGDCTWQPEHTLDSHGRASRQRRNEDRATRRPRGQAASGGLRLRLSPEASCAPSRGLWQAIGSSGLRSRLGAGGGGLVRRRGSWRALPGRVYLPPWLFSCLGHSCPFHHALPALEPADQELK